MWKYSVAHITDINLWFRAERSSIEFVLVVTSSAFIVSDALLSGVESAMNLTSTTSPMNLAMPRLLSVREAGINSRPTPTPAAQPFSKPHVPGDATTSAGTRAAWTVNSGVGPVGGVVNKTRSLTSTLSFLANRDSSTAVLGPRASTSLTCARPLSQSAAATTSAAVSVPPLRIARPHHLQAQMKQALNPSKLNVVRASTTAAAPLSSVTSKTTVTSGGHTPRLERADGSALAGGTTVAAARDNHARIASGVAPSTSKLHAAKSTSGVNSEQSNLLALKLAVAERRTSSDALPINTLKVDYILPLC